MRKVLFSILFLMLAGFTGLAQDFSYIYIQGDKKTPIYVKVEGNMAPRYGKNYAIIPQLAPGPTHITVLFQQNKFPPQNFTIMVPENSSRSFLLTQQESNFSLYDIDQRFFLRAGNTLDEDNPAGAPAALASKVPAVAATPTSATLQAPEAATPVITKPVPKKSSEPEFLDNVSLNRSEPLAPGKSDNVATSQCQVVLRNSDCPEAMGEADFQKLYRQMLSKDGDEDRVSFLLGQTNKCFATWQVRALVSPLTMDASRFSVVNRLYSRVSDQHNFSLLDDLFRESSWQQAFQKLINP